MITSDAPWVEPADHELSWFLAEKTFEPSPRPLDFTLGIHAIVFGLSHGLASLEFPLYAIRSRLVNGHLYLAVVPSASAEQDLPRRLQDMHDLSLRFTRNIRRAWEKQIKPEVGGYNRWIEKMASFAGSSEELAEKMRELRRVRGNQWYAIIRGVVAPTMLLQQRAEKDSVEEALSATREALHLVSQLGKTSLVSALHAVGGRLVDAGSIDHCEDIFWLEWMEALQVLRDGSRHQRTVDARKAEASGLSRASVSIGPILPPNAPRMYLISEILDLLGTQGRLAL